MKFGIGIPTAHEGVYLPTSFATPTELISIGQLAEKLGFYSAWELDNLIPGPNRLKTGIKNPAWYEILVSLSFFAAKTETIKLGAGVLVLPYRDPIILAKQIATLDVLSGGRLLLGVGLGVRRDEFDILKPRDKTAHRGEMLLECLEVLNVLLYQNDATFKGKYYEFQGLSLDPKPLQKPLPIYISGKTADTPRRVAKWGSGWLLSRMHPLSVRERIEKLHPYLVDMGRDISEIDIVATRGLSIGRTREEAMERLRNSTIPESMNLVASVAGIPGHPSVERVFDENLVGTPDDIIEQIHNLKADGVNHCVIFYYAVQNVKELIEQIQWFAEEVLPAFNS